MSRSLVNAMNRSRPSSSRVWESVLSYTVVASRPIFSSFDRMFGAFTSPAGTKRLHVRTEATQRLERLSCPAYGLAAADAGGESAAHDLLPLMPSSTVENYLKEIFLVADQSPAEWVPMGDVARAMGVVPGTATTMVKHLSNNGFIDYKPRVGVRLTPLGEQVAIGILRRHRLIEYFLAESLGLSWDAIHEEAERLEHAVSERVLDALDRFLGQPKTDPHGDPIPSAQGVVAGHATRPLSDCPQGAEVVVARILDQEASFLRFADERGMRPGACLRVTDLSPEADAITVQPAEARQPLSMSLLAAEKILVEQ